MKNLLLSISLIIFGSVSLFAIGPGPSPNSLIVGLIGYKPILVELNFQHYESPITFGFEAGIPEGYFTIAPKIGIEWLLFRKQRFVIKDGVFLKLSAAEFFSKAAAPDLRLIPQIGYCFGDRMHYKEIISIAYSYTLPVLKENPMIMRHRISIDISFPTWLFVNKYVGCEEDREN